MPTRKDSQADYAVMPLTLAQLQHPEFKFSQPLNVSELTLLTDFFETLEKSLLHNDFSLAENSLDNFLHPELFEISPLGQYTEREDIHAWLMAKSKAQQWQLCQFRVTVISPVDVLVCYQANSINNGVVKNTGSLRSSIWTKSAVKTSVISTSYQRSSSHHWRLRFHQATKN